MSFLEDSDEAETESEVPHAAGQGVTASSRRRAECSDQERRKTALVELDDSHGYTVSEK